MPPRKKPTAKKAVKPVQAAPDPGKLLGDLRAIIETGRGAVAQAVNAGLVLVYWEVGNRIRREILGERRAKYGEEIVSTLSRQLAEDYGSGFGRASLWRMVQFSERFADQKIVAALSRQLGWSHFHEIIPIEDDLKRDFYAEMCRIERWSVRTLRDKIRGMMYERTAIAKKPAKVIRADLDALRAEDRLTRTSSSATRTSSTSSASRPTSRRPTWSRPSSASWRPSSWNSAATSRSSPGRSG